MPIFNVTRRAIRHQISRGLNDLVATSGSLANPSVSGFYSPALVFGALNSLLGAEVSFYSGGGASQADSQRTIYAVVSYSSASPSLYGRLGILQPWAAAPSTNSGWELHQLFTRQQYEDAINSAIRRVARRMLLPAEEYMVAGAGLRNAAVDVWLAGTAVAPTGWTLAGTGAAVAQETNIVYKGARRSAKVTNGAGESASLTATTINLARYAGQTIHLKAIVSARNTNRVQIQFYDGSGTYTADHPGGSGGDGEGTWRELDTGPCTLINNPGEATCSLQMIAGGAVDTYLARMWIEHDGQWAYPLENRWAFIQSVEVEDQTDGWRTIPDEHWFINKDRSPRELVFMRDYYTPPVGSLIRVVGQQYPTTPAEEDNLAVDPEYLLARVSADLVRQLPSELQKRMADISIWEDSARRLETRIQTKPLIGSRPVEDI